MRSDEREILRQRFQFRCGYCGVRETDAGAELTADHFQPRSRGGSDELDNLVYCLIFWNASHNWNNKCETSRSE